jgi:hypothetical protein
MLLLPVHIVYRTPPVFFQNCSGDVKVIMHFWSSPFTPYCFEDIPFIPEC